VAGHNKWSKVKHVKGAADAKKSKVWTKIIREISVAAKMGGTDPAGNPRLRKALDEARAANITKDTVQRALTRASGAEGGADYEELQYEGYGPGGVAILVDCMTDNRNRTIGDVRAIFNKNGGNLGATGSVLFGFKKRGQIVFEKNAKLTEDMFLEIGLPHGLEDVIEDSDSFTLYSQPEEFLHLREAFVAAHLEPASAELAMVPDNTIMVTGDNAKALLKLIELLEEHDDVQHVWSNMDIDEKELESLAA